MCLSPCMSAAFGALGPKRSFMPSRPCVKLKCHRELQTTSHIPPHVHWGIFAGHQALPKCQSTSIISVSDALSNFSWPLQQSPPAPHACPQPVFDLSVTLTLASFPGVPRPCCFCSFAGRAPSVWSTLCPPSRLTGFSLPFSPVLNLTPPGGLHWPQPPASGIPAKLPLRGLPVLLFLHPFPRVGTCRAENVPSG